MVSIHRRKRLEGVHPDLVRVILRAGSISKVPFMVLEGVRSKERQQELFDKGASKTMNSRHIVAPNGYAHAVDIAPMIGKKVSWHWPHFYPLAKAVKKAAQIEGVPIEWGGDWKWKDGAHWQCPWKTHPGK